MTKRVPMIGHPVAQTRLPDAFNQHARAVGIDLAMDRVEVQPQQLESFVDSVRSDEIYAGFVTTIPHKHDLPGLVDTFSTTVELTGVCNSVRRDGSSALHGDILDGAGMADALEAAGATLLGASVSLVGCGAAGTAIAHELAARGAAQLEVTDQDDARAERLATTLRGRDERIDVRVCSRGERTGTVLVNASPVGMNGEGSPFTDSELAQAAVAADAVTTGLTPFLAAATERNLVTVDGAAMAAAQLEPLLRLLSDQPHPPARKR